MLRALRDYGPLSRGEIAERMELSRTTLSEITNSLLERGAITVLETDAARREGSGRPAERLALDPSSGQFMGIDFGHARVRIAVADASHEIIASGVERYSAGTAWPQRLAAAFLLIDRLSAETGVHFGALQGIGIGLAGPFRLQLVDAASGVPTRSEAASLVSSAFTERYGITVTIDNNSRLAALAEAIWVADGSVRDLLYVRLSDGVGGGLVVDGRLVAGSTGFAGEFGHVSAATNGIECRCGKRGCLETVASVPAIFAACTAAGVPITSLDELRLAVAKSDPIVDGVLRAAATALGRVLGSAAVMLNPAEIVIGGEIAQLAPVILEQVITSVAWELIAVDATPRIRVARFGDDDGALGAIAAVFHQSPLLDGYQEIAIEPRANRPMQRSIS